LIGNNYEEKLGKNQQAFIHCLVDVLERLNFFSEISFFEENGLKVFAKPHVLFEDMVEGIADGNYENYGFVASVPEEGLLINSNVLVEKVYETARELLWGYVAGKRKIVGNICN
jgi:hypothetical protein